MQFSERSSDTESEKECLKLTFDEEHAQLNNLNFLITCDRTRTADCLLVARKHSTCLFCHWLFTVKQNISPNDVI